MTAFVDFGRKTQYSLKNAMGDTKTVIPILKNHNQKYFAVSDYGECSGWVQQYFTCIKNDIIPILGMETFVNNYRFNINENNETFITKYGENESWTKSVKEIDDEELDWSQIDFPIDIFARTLEGYTNIIKIHNDAAINGVDKRPRTSDDFLKQNGKGIVALMPTPYSEISSHIYNGNKRSALNKYKFYKSIFDEVYVEIPILEDEDYREINKHTIQFCLKHHIPMIPVINTHYNEKDDGEAFPIFQKCGTLRGGMSYEVDYAPNMYTKTAEEVWNTFKQFHESNIFTEQLMRDLFLNLENLCKSFITLELDTSPKTPHFENSNEQLREHTMNGFVKYGFDKKGEIYKERIEYELDNICRAGFADYFLLIEQMFDWHVNKMGRLSSTGRGSAGGSLVLRCLGATKIDPIEHNLLFERFLDASRLDEIINQGGKLSGADFPDVDNDYPSNAKESVKDFFAETYGKNNICSVGTIGYLHVKSTLKELGRVFDIDDKEINNLTTVGLKDFEADDDGLPLDELKEKFPALKDFLETYPQVAKVFKNLQGTINCWGVHAGGILISDKSLLDQLPVRVNKGKLASCWSEGLNGRELGEMGFLKLDLLAIETLDIIEEAINLINARHPYANVNFDKIPLDDPRALARIENKENQGVFQFETNLALRVCKDMGGLRKFDDIASLSTLMRPAALQNKFGEKYGKRRDNQEKYFIPDCMKPYISHEYGMPIYQEGAYFFAMYMAGLDKVESYRFMKILYKGKMKGDKIPYWRNKFMNGCMNKIKHQDYEIELENGEKRIYTEYDKIKCIDGNEYTIQEIIDNGYEIADN